MNKYDVKILVDFKNGVDKKVVLSYVLREFRSFKIILWSRSQLNELSSFSCPEFSHIPLSVVATTRQNGTCDMLTSAKLSVGYLVVGITRELDKEPSLHCYSIYISYKWSMLQQCVYLMSTPQ